MRSWLTWVLLENDHEKEDGGMLSNISIYY